MKFLKKIVWAIGIVLAMKVVTIILLVSNADKVHLDDGSITASIVQSEQKRRAQKTMRTTLEEAAEEMAAQLPMMFEGGERLDRMALGEGLHVITDFTWTMHDVDEIDVIAAKENVENAMRERDCLDANARWFLDQGGRYTRRYYAADARQIFEFDTTKAHCHGTASAS